MNPVLATRYSAQQLAIITDQALLYSCACPAQLAAQIMALRALHTDQLGCMNEAPDLLATHLRIARAAELAHAELEQALADVLQGEGWDPVTLCMPENLRIRLEP